MDDSFIGRRITLFRDRQGITQETLAKELGLKSRQTLQTMEAGTRKITAEELLAIMNLSGLSLDFFTDPFRWEGEGEISFRATTRAESRLAAFEKTAGQWAMLWRWLSEESGCLPPLRPVLPITRSSSYEDVADIAERVASWFRLGPVPTRVLAETIERELGIPVCLVPMPKGISGATYHDERWHLICINQDEAPARRHFDLAHELFHALTWESFPPGRVTNCDDAETKTDRREQLADIFASNLLMPENEVRKKWNSLTHTAGDQRSQGESKKGSDIEVLLSLTATFQVSFHAIAWRLVNLGLLEKEQIATFSPPSSAKRTAKESDLPLPFSALYFQRLETAITNGRISIRKAAKLLGYELDELVQAISAHGFRVPFEL